MGKLFAIVALCFLLSACDLKIVTYDRCEEYLDSSDVIDQMNRIGSMADFGKEVLCESEMLIRFDGLSELHMLYENCHEVCSNELIDLFGYIEGSERIRATYCDSVGTRAEGQFAALARDRLEELNDRAESAANCLAYYVISTE